MPKKYSFWVVAHRGAKSETPENTRSAFDKAISYPIDGIELDVQYTRDNIPVIYHDRTLEKINGSKEAITDLSHKELEQIDWGSWFSVAFNKEKILTLKDVLHCYSKKTRLFIELKNYDRNSDADIIDGFTDSVLNLIKKNVSKKYYKNLFILSFDQTILDYAYQHEPAFNYIFNTKMPTMILNNHMACPEYAYAVCCNINKLTRRAADVIRQKGHKLAVYACNSYTQLQKARSFNLDIIMTDNPGLFY